MPSRICFSILKSLGWTIEVDWPESRKYVLIVYPHTSNWDFLLGICAARALGLDAHYIGKHSLFRKPYGWFFRALGGISVDRRRKENLIQQVAAQFDAADEFVLGLAPEGTRSKTDHWKSGFYHIARAAKVPVAMAYLDYGEKKIGLGGTFWPSDDIDQSYTLARRFFSGIRGKNQGQESVIQPR
jgi:1-acyl-sn-glycerol-3-phosphate acyltransferase